jgi:mRNA-degrading endonuclease RelE of RelBE toxin-antitoxin system
MFELRYAKHAERYFKKLKEKGLKAAYRKALIEIAQDPFQGNLKVGDLAGIYCVDIYYDKTNYEIAYQIYEEDDQIVVVILAGSRENFYQELKRYVKN